MSMAALLPGRSMPPKIGSVLCPTIEAPMLMPVIQKHGYRFVLLRKPKGHNRGNAQSYERQFPG
jgi:hypothetical protein